jgi:hypothetical protein
MASSNRVHIEKTDTSFIIGWTGSYRINGPTFVFLRSAERPGRHHPRVSN